MLLSACIFISERMMKVLTHKGTQTLQTERLTLRRFRMEDAQAVFDNWASEDLVTKYLTWPCHGSVEITKMVLSDWNEGYARQDFYQWAIEFEGRPVGSISVVSHDDRVGKAEIGYCIGSKWWHRGIVSEALKAVMAYLFEEVGFQRLEAWHDIRNPHSGAVMRKCGMAYEGTLRRYGRNNQGICDVSVYAALK